MRSCVPSHFFCISQFFKSSLDTLQQISCVICMTVSQDSYWYVSNCSQKLNCGHGGNSLSYPPRTKNTLLCIIVIYPITLHANSTFLFTHQELYHTLLTMTIMVQTVPLFGFLSHRVHNLVASYLLVLSLSLFCMCYPHHKPVKTQLYLPFPQPGDRSNERIICDCDSEIHDA